MKTFQIKDNDISDGFHTFTELYDHRCLLFVKLCLTEPEHCAWKWDDGTPDWFILYWESGQGQISYHIPGKFMKLIGGKIEHIPDHKWDGHTSADVINRLENACK